MECADFPAPRYEPPSDFLTMERLIRRYHATVPPPPKQLSFVPSLEDQVEEQLPRLMLLRKQTKARIKAVAKRFGVELKPAATAYSKALQRYQHRMAYEHYLQNKAWYDWVGTDDYRRYVTEYMGEIDRRERERIAEFWQRIEAGEEHVVSVKVKQDLWQTLGIASYHGPWQALIDTLHLTETGAKLMIERGVVKVEHGNPGTLISGHRYWVGDAPAARKGQACTAEPVGQEKSWCACGAEIDRNMMALNRKLGYSPPRCLACLGIDEAEAKSIIWYYRESGCTLFG